MKVNWWEQAVKFTISITEDHSESSVSYAYLEVLNKVKTASQAANVYWIVWEDFTTVSLASSNTQEIKHLDIDFAGTLFELKEVKVLFPQHLPDLLQETIDQAQNFVILPVKEKKEDGFLLLLYNQTVLLDEAYLAFLRIIRGGLIKDRFLNKTLLTYDRLKIRFKGIMEAIPHGILFIDDKGEYCWLNRKAAPLLGLPEGVNNPVLVSTAMQVLRKRTKNSEEIEAKVRDLFKGKNLEWNWIFSSKIDQIICVRYSPVSFNGLKGVLWLFEDITTHYQYELKLEQLNKDLSFSLDELQLSNERYRIAGKATKDLIWDWDLLDDKISWSEEYGRLTGFEGTEIITEGSTWLNGIHPEDREMVRESVYGVINNSLKSFWQAEYRFFSPRTDSYLYIIDRGSVIRSREGKALRMVGCMQNITPLKEKELEILQHNQTLQEIANLNSHYIRRPLANILGLIDLMWEANSENLGPLLKDLKGSSDELDDIVRQIAKKSRYFE